MLKTCSIIDRLHNRLRQLQITRKARRTLLKILVKKALSPQTLRSFGFCRAIQILPCGQISRCRRGNALARTNRTTSI